MMLLANRIKEVKKLRAEKHYGSSIDECGKILEGLFRDLYKEYLPELKELELEKVLEFRRKTRKQTDKFTIGQWIGLFRSANLFKIIQDTKKQPDEHDFVFFTSDVVKTINELRNRNVHSDKDLRCYNQQQVALFIESAIFCILRELKQVKETDLIDQEILPNVQYNFIQKDIKISREEILSASKNPICNEFRFSKEYVEIEGKKYSTRGLLAIASGKSISTFTLNSAKEILEKLGFKIKTQQLLAEIKKEKDSVEIKTRKMPYYTMEEGLLHIVSIRLFDTLPELISETKKNYSTVDGIETLSPELAIKIIKNAWKNNNKIISSFKNEAFKFHLERLLNVLLD